MDPQVIPFGTGKAVNVLGIPITIRLHGNDTGGVLSVVESVDQANGGPPLHLHRNEDETFQVLEGEYEFTCAGKKVRAREGDTIFAPRNVPHTYRCISEKPGRLMAIITPANFERFFEEIGALTPEQQEIPRVIEIASRYGLEFPPPPEA